VARAREQSELDATAGPAEDDREEQRERIALTNELAEDVGTAAELAQDQRDFLEWAGEQFGDQDALYRWLSKQGDEDDQRDRLNGLAERYVAELEADADFEGWLADTLGEDIFDQLDAMTDADREEALSDLAEAFDAEYAEDGDDAGDDVEFGDY
jgi:hypothetical protein